MLKDYKAYEYQDKSWNLYNEIKDKENQHFSLQIYMPLETMTKV